MIVGWDIGGVNTKVARIAGGKVLAVRGRPFELQRSPAALVPLLREMALEVGAGAGDLHAVTMTAELSQMFRTKREGVAFVVDAVAAAFPGQLARIFTVDGRFVDAGEARQTPLAVAAANWVATARMVARQRGDALLVDVGTTTTDLIPIVGGAVVALGATDPERMASGELVYTGALRTPVEAIARQVPFRGQHAGLSAEAFAIAGDVHLWRGDLDPDDYSVPTPDGRPATREFAGERLARAICADREMLDDDGVTAIADSLADAQVECIATAIRRSLERHPSIREAAITGLGSFAGERAATRAGLDAVLLSSELGNAAARCAPATAVALLFEQATSIDLVVKIGGSLLAHPDELDRVLADVRSASRKRRILVVPGGGALADAVRDVDRRMHVGDDAAHWMAVLAMDQYAHVLLSRMPRTVVVDDRRGIAEALTSGALPVLAPSRWLRAVDPLPHSWDVTSDSIAAWICGHVGARQLLLIKAPGATGALVDPYFTTAVPAEVSTTIASADQRELLCRALGAAEPSRT
jgi:(4-(4-[2-(gamma-L-glutamylamino)ethyl]phenoxymethyl)furan-2-yl)methanamine synthase